MMVDWKLHRAMISGLMLDKWFNVSWRLFSATHQEFCPGDCRGWPCPLSSFGMFWLFSKASSKRSKKEQDKMIAHSFDGVLRCSTSLFGIVTFRDFQWCPGVWLGHAFCIALWLTNRSSGQFQKVSFKMIHSESSDFLGFPEYQLADWCFGTFLFHFSIYFSIISWECHQPNWRTHIFQRGRAQPSTRLLLTIINHIIAI